jgi:hypothetical protein
MDRRHVGHRAPGIVSEAELARLGEILASDRRLARVAPRIVAVARLVAFSGAPPEAASLFPRWHELREDLRAAIGEDAPCAGRVEEALLALYAHVHMHEAPYTDEERQVLRESGGYWAHAGGLSPVLEAGRFLRARSVSADLGAGNGLQGLLMQALDPHALTLQVELSAQMVEIGKGLARWLGVPAERLSWRVEDLRVAPLDERIDVLYLYRPLRPESPEGDAFYRRIAAALTGKDRATVVLSVADALRRYLVHAETLHEDGQLSCYRVLPAGR